MRLSKFATNERDELLWEMHLEGQSPQLIADDLGFKNAQVVRVKISKIKRKAREALLATPDDALSVVTTPAE